eukprot:scaffold213037_cov50-Cyclotella_meneghiniana.AAC.1
MDGFCLVVPLSSIEMGTRPNDYFLVLSLPPSTPSYQRAAVAAAEEARKLLFTSYGGDARTVTCARKVCKILPIDRSDCQ